MAKKKSADEPATTTAPEAGELAVMDRPEAEERNWRDQADDFTKQAKEAAWNAATSAKNTTGDALHGLSKLIAETAGTVDDKLGAQYGDYARKAAEAVAGAARSLDEKDLETLADDARNFVRKSPAVAIGAAAIVGFVLMRMMRGSGDDA